MVEIIIEDMNCREVKFSTSLPFPCLITRLCKEAHVPIFAGIDVETYATKKYDLEKSKDESRYELKLHKQIPKVFEPNAATQPKGESIETSSTMPQSSQYAFTLANFARVIKKADRQDRQLKLFAEQLGLFVNRAITAALEPYKHLHARMGDMEARERQPPEFLIAKFEESEDDAPFIDLLEWMTLITPPLATEAATPDPLSAAIATEATADCFGVIPP
ncbi:hypothetical protein HAX54_026151 [Datura stramonium]|uniref:Uncharacterized protein n=1 Tax=Datura stramonium TaxID=4076 RepID=A0ABS8V0Y1_DATST|nr:hypothetical protein [Datura stramonium]